MCGYLGKRLVDHSSNYLILGLGLPDKEEPNFSCDHRKPHINKESLKIKKNNLSLLGGKMYPVSSILDVLDLRAA